MSVKNSVSNLMSVNIDNFIKKTEMMVSNIIASDLSVKNVPSIMIWGAPGVGKSDGVRELAVILEKRLSKKVVVTDLRLLLFNPVDLRGLPTLSNDKTKAIWVKPEILDLDASNDIINILFLDEITAASQSVQAAAYQITLDHRIGEHILPDNTMVIAAGNRKKDMSFSNTMPKALANRFLHFNIEPDFDEWKEWAEKHNINKKVIGFLDYKRNYFHYGLEDGDEIAYASPRSWEKVSFLLNKLNSSPSEMKELISGLVGRGITEEFLTFINMLDALPNVEDVFLGKEIDIPERADILWTLICALNDKSKKFIIEGTGIDNLAKFAMKLPVDFSYVLYKNIVNQIKNLNVDLLMSPSFEEWGDMLNDNIVG